MKQEQQAQSRYGQLISERQPFLDKAREASYFTLPYLLTDDGVENGVSLHTPWQSVGAKGVNVLASKLMLALFPVNTSFFKLQVNDAELEQMPDLPPDVRSEIDLSLSKIERTVMQQISETTDRVALDDALKHLIVTGNALLYAGKKALRLYPIDRFVVSRDGDGNVMEIITKEIVDRSLLPKEFQENGDSPSVGPDNAVGEDGPKAGVAQSKGRINNAVVYTHVKRVDGQHKWYQECDGKMIPGSSSSSPLKSSPWMPVRFNHVDGESYGRGRVEEFIGDLKSLESLSKSMVEGSAAAAKVVFLVNPGSTTKPQNLANSTNGSIIAGRPDDVSVVQVGKTADFRTVLEMINMLTQRLSDAFLVLDVRKSERTTATEVQATIQELNEQLGGIYSGLTAELLQPYLNRKLYVLQRSGKTPPLPKGLVSPTVVAGLYGIGRGQDKQALVEFVQTLAQSMGPEALAQYVDPTEYIKRLAAASGIDYLNLIKSPETMAQEQQKMQQAQMQQALIGQAGSLAKSPMGEQMIQQMTQQSNDRTESAETSAEATAEAQAGPQA